MTHKYKRFVLPNGLRVLTVPHKDSPSVAIEILVEAGTAYENARINGLSHFLEHMCFKGTKKRPRAMDIASELESMGAGYNAFTSRDVTGYWVKVSSLNFKRAFDVIADMYLSPNFEKKEIEKEKGVIVEEINMYEDDPRDKVSAILTKAMYGDQPAGWNVIGTKENVKKFSRDDFLSYQNKHYTTAKTLVVIAGSFDEKTAKKEVVKYFSHLPKSSRAAREKTFRDRSHHETVTHYKKLDQTHFEVGIKAFPVSSEKKYTLLLLATILGGGMSSRLFQKVREELGAAYYVGASSILYVTHGHLSVFGGLNHQKRKSVLEAVVEEINRLKKDLVLAEELVRAKDYRIGKLMLSLETASDIASFYGGQEITLGRLMEPKEIISKIKKVTPEDIRSLARELIKKNRLTLAVVGPYREKEEFERIIGGIK